MSFAPRAGSVPVTTSPGAAIGGRMRAMAAEPVPASEDSQPPHRPVPARAAGPTATGCSARCTTPRTRCRRRCLRAWRSSGDFEGRASLRTWLYRIATNACLRALENRGRRPLPSGLGGPASDPDGAAGRRRRPEVPWLQPFPDALVGADRRPGLDRDVARTSMRLALIAALQYLPARQRAVLILRDVLGWRAAEVAELLGTTTTAVNSALQRARAAAASRPRRPRTSPASRPTRSTARCSTGTPRRSRTPTSPR